MSGCWVAAFFGLAVPLTIGVACAVVFAHHGVHGIVLSLTIAVLASLALLSWLAGIPLDQAPLPTGGEEGVLNFGKRIVDAFFTLCDGWSVIVNTVVGVTVGVWIGSTIKERTERH